MFRNSLSSPTEGGLERNSLSADDDMGFMPGGPSSSSSSSSSNSGGPPSSSSSGGMFTDKGGQGGDKSGKDNFGKMPNILPEIASSDGSDVAGKSSIAATRVIDTKYFVPPDLTIFQMWGPMFMIFFFLGLLTIVLMWLYVYINFESYHDRITVLSLGNWFNHDPQASFEKYIQQSTQESIAAAMQDIRSSSNNIQSSVNRLQGQMDVNASVQQQMTSIVDWFKNALAKTYVSGSTVKMTAPAPAPKQ